MTPSELRAESFGGYPPEARALAGKHVALFQQLPLAFLPLLLRELVAYDWKFPAEREELDHQLGYLDEQSKTAVGELMAPFRAVRLSDELSAVDWVNVPAQFSEKLSAYLWSTHQIDAFRAASLDYVQRVNAGRSSSPPATPRLGMVLVGKDASQSQGPFFRRLQPHGVYFTNVEPDKAITSVFETLQARATAHPVPYGHWYIDGADLQVHQPGWTCVSYNALQPVRQALVEKMTKVMQPGGGGPELLRSELQRMRPEDVDLSATSGPVMSRFELSLLTEGSGTQIFSTTFVQWAAREALRRAQPYTLLARFTPRRRNAPIGTPDAKGADQFDADGSLVDAEMGAYYTWINQQRLSQADEAGFLVWYEGHSQAVAIGPALKAGTQENRPMTVKQILAQFA